MLPKVTIKRETPPAATATRKTDLETPVDRGMTGKPSLALLSSHHPWTFSCPGVQVWWKCSFFFAPGANFPCYSAGGGPCNDDATEKGGEAEGCVCESVGDVGATLIRIGSWVFLLPSWLVMRIRRPTHTESVFPQN